MEGKRIFGSRKMQLVILLLLCAVGGLLAGQELWTAAKGGYSFWAERSFRKELTHRLTWYSEREAQPYLTKQLAKRQEAQMAALYGEQEYDVSLVYQSKVLEEELGAVEHVLGYPSYLDEVIHGSDRLGAIGIFQTEDALAQTNLERTGQRYGALAEVTVAYGNDGAVRKVMEYEGIPIVVFVFLCLLVWNFFEEEKKGLRGMFYATPGGRERLALRRIGVLAAGSAGFVTGVYAVVFAVAGFLYGGMGDLGRSVQSVSCFMKCPHRLLLWQYLLLTVLVHALCAFVAALLLWMLFLVVHHRVLALLTILAVFAVELVCNRVIGDQSPLVWLKYENLYYLLQPDLMLRDYLNLRILGRLVNREVLFFAGTLLLGAVCGVQCVRISSRPRTVVSTGRIERVLLLVGKHVQQKYYQWMAKLSLTGMECYQILIARRGLVIVVIWLALLWSGMDLSTAHVMGTTGYLQEVYGAYSGPDDGRLRTYVQAQTDFFVQLDEKMQEVSDRYEKGEATEEEMQSTSYLVQSYETKRSGLDTIKNQLAYIERMKEEQGQDVWLVDNKGYRILWTGDGLYQGAGYGKQQRGALFGILVLILLVGMVFSYDRSCGMEQMIQATPLGRTHLFRVRIRTVWLLCLGICILTYGSMVYEVNCNYPLTCLSAPVQSLLFLKDYPLHISILTFMILLFVIHFMTLASWGMVICALSAVTEGYRGILWALLLLGLPSVLQMMSVSWCAPIAAIQPVGYVETLQEHGFWYSLVQVMITMGIGVWCYWFTRKKWCR